MKVWIDDYGDVVWDDYRENPTPPIATGYLHDGCRHYRYKDNSFLLFGSWMILE